MHDASSCKEHFPHDYHSLCYFLSGVFMNVISYLYITFISAWHIYCFLNYLFVFFFSFQPFGFSLLFPVLLAFCLFYQSIFSLSIWSAQCQIPLTNCRRFHSASLTFPCRPLCIDHSSFTRSFLLVKRTNRNVFGFDHFKMPSFPVLVWVWFFPLCITPGNTLQLFRDITLLKHNNFLTLLPAIAHSASHELDAPH